MAGASALNDQIAEAGGQAGVLVLGDAPTLAAAALYQSFAHTTLLLYEGAAAQYQRSQAAAQAAAVLGTIQLYAIGTTAGAVASGRIATAGTAPPSLLQLVANARALHKD